MLGKIYKHYVSKVDYFIHTTAKKPKTASQKATLKKVRETIKKRDNKTTKTKSIWDKL